MTKYKIDVKIYIEAYVLNISVRKSIKSEVLILRAIKPMDLRNNQKEMLDLAYNGEILFVSRPAKKNVVVLSEDEFNKREKALKNVEYAESLISLINLKGEKAL